MRILLWAERQKMRRSPFVWIALFSTVMVAVLVFVGGQDMGYGVPEINKAGWFITLGQVFATLFALPAVIALFGSYLICREEQEGTLPALQMIPVNETKLVAAKMLTTLLLSILLYGLLFCITFLTEAVLHFSDLSGRLLGHFLKAYLVDGICVFIAIAPIIACVARWKKNYWLALVITELYSIGGMFASMSNTLKAVYPIGAVFTLSGYYEATREQIILSGLSLLVCLLLTLYLLKGVKSGAEN